MTTGRGTDDAMTWYCHYRLGKLLAEGATQKALAEKGELPKSAVNFLLKHGKGVGSMTAAGFAKMLDFRTRGALTDAADSWWATREARRYAQRQQAEMQRERRIKDIDESLEHETAKKSRPKTA